MGRCSVLECKSDSGRKNPDISFHSFPDDDLLRKKWIKATGRPNWTPKKASKICSKHFFPSMLYKKKKLTFLPNAVPLLEIKTSMPSTSSSVSSRDIELSMPSTSSTVSSHDIIDEQGTIDDLRTEFDLKTKTISSSLKASSCFEDEEENMESNVDLCSSDKSGCDEHLILTPQDIQEAARAAVEHFLPPKSKEKKT